MLTLKEDVLINTVSVIEVNAVMAINVVSVTEEREVIEVLMVSVNNTVERAVKLLTNNDDIVTGLEGSIILPSNCFIAIYYIYTEENK